MGANCCGPKSKNQNKLFYESQYHQAKITLVKGEITDEETDVIVNASELPYNTQSSYILKKAGQKVQQQLSDKATLNPEEASHSIAGNLKSKHIVHSALPQFVGNDGGQEDLKTFGKTFINILKQTQDLNARSISFTDCQNIQQQKLPCIFAASALMLGVVQYFAENQDSKIEHIKYVSNDDISLRNMQFEVEKKVDCTKIAEVENRIKQRDAQFFKESKGGINLGDIQFNINEKNINEINENFKNNSDNKQLDLNFDLKKNNNNNNNHQGTAAAGTNLSVVQNKNNNQNQQED